MKELKNNSLTDAKINAIIVAESDDEKAWELPASVRLCSDVYTIEATMIDRITINPHVHFGKPCIAGTRITVQNVLELLEEGLSFDKIILDYYPDLEIEDIHACLRYAIALVAAEDIHLTPLPV